MADQPLLEVNCTNCPGNQACEDCLVRFFLAERDAAVVSLADRGPARHATSPARPASTRALAGNPAGDELLAPFGPGLSLPPDLSPDLPFDLAAAVATLEAAGLEPKVLSVEPHGTARAS